MPFVRLDFSIVIGEHVAAAKAAVILKGWHEIVGIEVSFVKMIFYSVNCSEWTLSFQFMA